MIAKPSQLPDITIRLERELAELLAATSTPGPIAALPPGPAARREHDETAHQRIASYAAELRAAAERYQSIDDALSRLAGISAETTASPGCSPRSHSDHSPRQGKEDCS